MITSSIGYAGIAIIAIFVLFIIISCIRGFSKSFNGFFCTLLAIIIALLLVGAFNDKIVDSKAGTALNDKLLTASTSWGEAFNAPAKNVDGTVYIQVDDGDGNKVWVDINEAPNTNKIAAFAVAKLAPRFITTDGEEGSPEQTLASQIMWNFTALIIAACSFVVYLIVLLIIFSILRKITKKMGEAAKVGKAIDKILGAIIGVVFALMIVWVVLAIIQACKNVGNTQSIIDTYITPCKITSFFNKYNYLGVLFEKIFVG